MGALGIIRCQVLFSIVSMYDIKKMYHIVKDNRNKCRYNKVVTKIINWAVLHEKNAGGSRVTFIFFGGVK